MVECLPQQFLRNGATLKDLEASFQIRHRRSLLHPNLVGLKYDQIESPLGTDLVRQCRGLILDENNNWEIVARPFDKFFNYGEAYAAQIDWATARVQEKLDGSLCILYFYDGKWRVGTTGLPDASGEVSHGTGWCFKELFWWVWDALGYKVPGPQWHSWTFMFELCTQFNRVVVRHESARIVFISARSLDGEEEMLGAEEFPVKSYRWEAVKEYPLQSLDDVMTTFDKLDPLQTEGYVIVDANLNRIKVKHPGYVALHHMRGNGYGPRRILEVVRKGEAAEVVANFPEWKEDFEAMQFRLADLAGQLEAEYERLKDIPLQKAFALEALQTRLPASLFAVRSGKALSIRDFLNRMNVDSLLVALEM